MQRNHKFNKSTIRQFENSKTVFVFLFPPFMFFASRFQPVWPNGGRNPSPLIIVLNVAGFNRAGYRWVWEQEGWGAGGDGWGSSRARGLWSFASSVVVCYVSFWCLCLGCFGLAFLFWSRLSASLCIWRGTSEPPGRRALLGATFRLAQTIWNELDQTKEPRFRIE